MNVLHLCLANVRHSSLNSIKDLAVKSAARGHKVKVLTTDVELAAVLNRSGVEGELLPNFKGGIYWHYFRLRAIVRRVAEKERTDIIHAWDGRSCFLAQMINRQKGVPFVGTFFHVEKGFPVRWVWARAKFIMVSNVLTGHYLRDKLKIPPDKLKEVSQGVDLEKFRFRHISPAEKETVGLCGSFSPPEEQLPFIQTAARLARQSPGFRVIVLDVNNEIKDDVRNLFCRWGLDKQVSFHAGREDLQFVFPQLNCLVFYKTDKGNFQDVLLQAMACGVPVIAAREKETVQVLKDGNNGLLLNAPDTRVLNESLTRLLRDEKLANSLSSQARKDIEKFFDINLTSEKTISLYHEVVTTPRILVILSNGLKDALVSLPFFAGLRKKFPKGYIAAWGPLSAGPLLDRLPDINEVILDTGKEYRWKKFLLLRNFSFDISVDLRNTRLTRLITLLSGIPRRCGAGDVGVSAEALKETPGFILKESDEIRVRDIFQEEWVSPSQVLIGMDIDSPASSRRWQLPYFVRLIDDLARDFRARVLIICEKSGVNFAREIETSSKAKPIIIAKGISLMQKACLLRKCRAFISPDCDTLYLAASLGVPCIALFGPTDPKKELPRWGRWTVLKSTLACVPCYRRKCRKVSHRQPGICSPCMTQLAPGHVYQAVSSIMLDQPSNQEISGSKK